MSKQLLYCKDLLNRTLTRSLLFVVPQLVACLIILFQAISPAEAAGPLSVKKTNPRYFFDSRGNSVYLTGSYLNEYNLLTGSSDFASYLDFLQQQKQNFTRVWAWEQSPWSYDATGQVTFSAQPYERTGPGLALDGGLKFDLTRFNQVYFDQLRSRVVEASRRGLYVSVALFEGFSTQKRMGRVNPWLSDPFQQVNNINGINGDPDRNGSNEEFFSLAFPSLVSLQETFTRKVVDTLNDLDNVLYEVSGNGLVGSLPWQYHMMDHIKRYQKKQVNQHPVGISDFYAGATADVFNSSADWIIIQETNLNPPSATSNKVLIMERTPVSTGEQILSTSPISLFQLLPDTVSSQNSGISSSLPSSNGVTPLSATMTQSTANTGKSSSNSQQTQVSTPTITPNGGVYSSSVPVTLQTTTPGASIYYTTDGQSPTQSSRLYTGKFKLSGSTLVKAKAFKSNFDPSSEASAWFANATSPVLAPSGPVAYWKFDEGSGTSVADSSGNGNTGTLINGPLWTSGRIGNALFFDGIDDNVTIPDSTLLDLSGAFTLSAWVNPISTFTDYRSIIAKNYKYYLYSSSTGFCGDGGPMGGFFEGKDIAACQSSPLSANTWTHLSVTYNGSTITLYRDGSAIATYNVSGTLSPTIGTLQIGASQYGEYFKGLIDEVRVYNRALSDTEIQSLYQQDSRTTSQTVAMPIISPSGGSYSGSVPVTMQTATSVASIYYTTNGSTPTTSSTLYTGSMTLTSSATVKAKAFKNGSASAEASASFTVTQPFGFSLANSGDKSVIAGSSTTNSISATLVSGTAQPITFSASGLPTGTTGSFSSTSCNPGCSPTLNINTSASTPAGSSTITVTASGDGLTKTTTFNLNVSLQTVATPAITPSGGTYSGSVPVTMQTATSGASIYYTTNGSTPTTSSSLYTGTMSLASSAMVKAKAFKTGYNASADASASFIVSQPFSFSVFNAGNISVIAGSSGTNSINTTLVSGSAQAVTFLASGLPTGATASFSSNSCSPACSSTLTINANSSTPAGTSNITVAVTGGGVTKNTTFGLTVTLPTVATPEISPNGGSYGGSISLTMQTATSGASIYYTTNGSSPTQSSTLYTGGITLTSNAVVKAKAFKTGYNASTEASASFTLSGSGPVAYWKFDEGSGTSVADSSGNGNTGTLINGPLWTSGRIGNALFFDGIDDNVTIPDSTLLDLSGAFTLSAWVNPISTFTDYRSIIAKNYKYYLYSSSTGFCGDGGPMGGFFEGKDIAACQSSPLSANTWTHLSVTYNGSTITLYRDGSAIATYNVSGTLSPTIGTLQIGASQYGEYFKGLIDEVRVYNRALSDTEIQSLYQQDSRTTSQTVAMPIISPSGGSYSGSVPVTMQTATSVASIYYTTNGSTPTTSSTLYTGSMTLTSSATVKAKAFKNGSASAEASASFTVTQPFGFSLANSGDKSVIAGSSTTNSISTALVSGTAQPITFSASGLPTGTTGSFSSTSCNPGCSTVLSVNTTGSTPAGNFPITISAIGGGVTRTTAFTLSVTLAFTAAIPTTSTNSGTGNIYYVAKTGSDSNSCAQAQNQSTPKLTITAGLTCLSSGDTLNIKAGTYNDGISYNNTSTSQSGTSYNNATTIQAFGTDVVTITKGIGFNSPLNGQEYKYFIFKNLILDGTGMGFGGGGNGGSVHHIKIDHIEVKNIPTFGMMLGGSDGSGHDLWVTHSLVHDGGTDAFHHCFYTEGSNNIIEYSECYNWTGYGIHNYSQGSIFPSNNIYRYNWIHHTGTYTGQGSTAILLMTGDNNQAYGNIVSGNQNGISFASNNNLIYNNTVYGNGVGFSGACCYAAIFGDRGSNNVVKNNIVFGNQINAINTAGTTGTVISNNLLTNPSFVNAAANSFTLQPGSAAIDAGTSSITPAISVTTFDGSAPDIGALEY